MKAAHPDFETTHSVISDNCSSHVAQATKRVNQLFKWPLTLTAPGSMDGVGIEGIFMVLKAKKLELDEEFIPRSNSYNTHNKATLNQKLVARVIEHVTGMEYDQLKRIFARRYVYLVNFLHNVRV